MAEQNDLESVARVKRKSPVNAIDMQLFFGTFLRPKEYLRPRRIYYEFPANKRCGRPASHDFGLPQEVVESILSHLPILDLIMTTGVNMTIRTIVQASPTLQRKLFLLPTNEPRQFVKLEHPDHACGIAPATQNEFDGIDEDGNEITNDSESLDGDGDGPHEPQWGVAWEAGTPCPFLVREFQSNRLERLMHRGPEMVCFSESTARAEHWANMHLTSPPCTEVYISLHYSGGYARQYNISATREICCETGVTIASLLDARYMEGNVELTRENGWWPSRGDDHLIGVRRHTTVACVLAAFEGWRISQDWACMMGKMELDLSRTTVEIGEMVFPEWRANLEADLESNLESDLETDLDD